MSSRNCLTLLLAAAASSVALGADPVSYTDPVGFVKIAADAAVDSSTPTYSFVSHSLAEQRVANAVVDTGGTESLTVTGTPWSGGQFAGANGPHYVIVGTGAVEGDILDIVSNTSNTLTLASGSGELSGLAGETITIYKHNTLASIFGANPTANGMVGALDANTADQVLLFEEGSGFVTYFYKNVNIPDFLDPNDITGWVTSADNTNDASNTPLPPNRGFIILRRATSDFEVTAFGEVMDDSINVPIAEGYNLICVPYPIPDEVTLLSSGLYDAADPGFLTSLQPGLDTNDSELVVLWNGTGYTQYFYKNVNIPDFLDPNDITGWVSSADNTTDAGTTPLNGSFFILRKSPNPPIDLIFPSVLDQ